MKPTINDGVPELTVEEVQKLIGKVKLIDVRRPDEFNGDLGHVEGAQLVTLGDDLLDFLDSADRNQDIVFICRSGGRSGRATVESMHMGYKSVANMTGGMLRWNEAGLPVSRK